MLCDASAVNVVAVSIRLSICLTQADTVPKWLNAGSCKQCHMIAQGL